MFLKNLLYSWLALPPSKQINKNQKVYKAPNVSLASNIQIGKSSPYKTAKTHYVGGGIYTPPSFIVPPPAPQPPPNPRKPVPYTILQPTASQVLPSQPLLKSTPLPAFNSGAAIPIIHRNIGQQYAASSGYWRGAMMTGRATSGFWMGNLGTPPDRPVLDVPDVSLFQQRLPQEMLSKYTVAGKNIMLRQSDYKASGGEGLVYVKNGYAYKIYHDAKKMIAPGKIQELATIGLPNVLGPQDVIYLDNVPSGFVMKYVSDTEFLCKLFTKGFRDKNNITPNIINGLVKNMQQTLAKIHTKDVLVVDYNEMNFLVNNAYDTVYHIDVDSYQTPSYPATAIMESIRDRKVTNRKFTTDSDWFSFACVAFQLYVGTHPYKGRHPDYAAKDWQIQMDKGISVFNPKCKLPPACQTLSVIPKGHLKWFEAVLEKGERSAPPEPDNVNIVLAAAKPTIIDSNDSFTITKVRGYDDTIEMVRFIDGVCYVLTHKSVWGNDKQFTTFAPQTGYVAKRTVKDLVAVQGDQPLIVEFNKIEGKLRYRTFAGKEVGEVDSKGFFMANRALYTVAGGSLIEVSFANRGAKVSPMQQSVANVFDNHQVFDGLVIQDMLGTCRFSIPFAAGKCETVRVKELDNLRIVDARYEKGIAIVMFERGGKYHRYTFNFSAGCKVYTVRLEKDVDLADINFTVKDNGVCVAENDDKLEIFVDNTKVKNVNSPINGMGCTLLADKNTTLIVNGDGVYQVAAKQP